MIDSAIEGKMWRFLFTHQLSLLKRHGCPEYLEGLERLKLDARSLPSFARVETRLKRVSGWTLVPVNRELDPYRYFTLLAERKFPLNPRMRPPSELSFPKVPDFFHGAFGHAPLLTDIRYHAALQRLGRLGVSFGPRAPILSPLRILNWYSFETGMLLRKKKLNPYGAELLSSPMQLVSALGGRCEKRPFHPADVLRRKLSFGRQKACFFISDFGDLGDMIQAWAHARRERLAS